MMKLKDIAPLVCACLALNCSQREKVDLMLYNGQIHTLNDAVPHAKALVIRDGKILAIGWNEEIKTKYDAERKIDAQGRAVFPGFTDAHAHLEGLGAKLANLDLEGTRSVDEIRQRVAERAGQLPSGAWLRGRGWDQNDWTEKEFPNHQLLDEVSGDHPIYLKRVDGHAVWVNKRVLDLAGITSATLDPGGGKILRDTQGNPTGVLIDNAVDLVDSVMPQPSALERTAYIEEAVQECLRFGLTEVHDMGVDAELIGIYKTLIEEKRFPFRVYAAIDGLKDTWRDHQIRGPETDGYDNRLTVRALKLYADGALGSRGAALLKPYSDDKKNSGLLLTPVDSLRTAARAALEKGFQVCIHAIGDRANREVLNVYEEVFRDHQDAWRDARFRVEHAQVLSQDDFARFGRLHVIPSMQPTHCTSDMYWAGDRLGPERVRGAYAWRSLIDAGSIIPAGSDFPVESANPLLGFYAAITRQDDKGYPKDGWYPAQRMRRIEALKAFTVWAAYAAFEEHSRGSLEPGKLGDLVVLSNDILECSPEEILGTRVLYTIVGGEIVFSAEE